MTTVQVPLRAALRVMKDCCAALHYIHNLGIVHRDLRSANVLLDSASVADHITAHVADFGLSHQLSSAVTYRNDAPGGTVTRSGSGGAPPDRERPAIRVDPSTSASVVRGDSALGPVLFFPPEALRKRDDGARVTSKPGDVYMVGALLFEVVAGGLPPYYWIPDRWWAMTGRDAALVAARLTCSSGATVSVPAGGSSHVPRGARGVGSPGSAGFSLAYPGLLGLSMVEAMALDGVQPEWRLACPCPRCVTSQREAGAAGHATAAWPGVDAPTGLGAVSPGIDHSYAPLMADSDDPDEEGGSLGGGARVAGHESYVALSDSAPGNQVHSSRLRSTGDRQRGTSGGFGTNGGPGAATGSTSSRRCVCGAQLTRIMAMCMHHDPARRPTTDQLNTWFERLLRSLSVVERGGDAADDAVVFQ